MLIDKGVLNRLELLIQETGQTRKQFADSIGHSPSTITEIFSGRIKNLSGTLGKILELKYSINLEWLKTGKGKQYKSSLIINCPREHELFVKFRRLRGKYKDSLLILAETLYLQQTKDKQPHSHQSD